MRSAAKQRIVLGAVRVIVIAPVVFGFSLPLIALFHSLVPMYAGLFASLVVTVSGGVEIGRGVLAQRADKRALPEARIIE